MAAIGHICLQWARLEMALLGVIYAIEDMPVEKGEIIFGGLDIKPRVNMAIGLARYSKVPQRIVRRLVELRTVIQKDLMDQRNQAVHGAHKNLEGDETTVRMVRWSGDKKDKTLSVLDLHQLGVAILEAADECWAVRDAIGEWKFGPKDPTSE